MKISAVSKLDKRPKADVLILPFWKGKKEAEPAAVIKEFAELVDLPIKSKDFLGKAGETLLLFDSNSKHEPRILMLGLGDKKKINPEELRRSYAGAVKASLRKKHKVLNILLPDDQDAEAVCEGTLLVNYHFLEFKNEANKEDPKPFLDSVCFIGKAAEDFKETQKIIESVNFTRDLVNGNADDTNPQALSEAAKNLGKKYSAVKTTVLRKKELEKEKLGLLLAVSRGAVDEPALIIMEYRGDPKSKETTAIVGKGITYDTGGLNIKPTGGMETMKCDMAGAGAVLGVIKAAAEIGLKKNIIGVVAAAENAIGPASYKPGDVYRSHSGKTVEISNTDAEGRLVLADAISYLLTKYQPSRVIDLATLTGGIVVALGEEITGLFSNNDKLAEELTEAGLKTHERLWRMPLLPEYKDNLKSALADIKNSGARKASAPTAAVFLQEFVRDVPWAHLDIAGTAYLSDPKHYHQTPATGVGVRLLIAFLQHAK